MTTLVIAENEAWTAGAEFAVAMRTRGHRTLYLTADSSDTLKKSKSRRLTASLVSELVPASVSPDGALTDVGLAQLARVDAADVQAPEAVIHWLSTSRHPVLFRNPRSQELPVEKVMDKILLNEFLDANGLGAPLSWETLADVPRSADFPLMIKSRLGTGGAGIQVCANYRELVEAVEAREDREYFVQKYYTGSVLDVAGVAKDGEIVQMITYENRVDPLKPYAFAYGLTVTRNEPLVEFARKVVGALGLTGPFAFDAVPDEMNRPLLIDANLRIWGGWTACQAAGMDVLGAYEYALGLGPRPRQTSLAAGQYHSLLRVPPLGVGSYAQRASWLVSEIGTAHRRAGWMGRRWALMHDLQVVHWALSRR